MKCERCNRPKATDADRLARGDCRGCDECDARCWGGRACTALLASRCFAAEAEVARLRAVEVDLRAALGLADSFAAGSGFHVRRHCVGGWVMETGGDGVPRTLVETFGSHRRRYFGSELDHAALLLRTIGSTP